MIPRIGLDLEPGFQISRVLADLDLLDIAYGATHGGVQSLIAPLSVFGPRTPYSLDLFFRPGLPLLTIKTELSQQEQLLGMSNAPDRVLITGEHGRSLKDFGPVQEFVQRVSGFCRDIGVLVEPEASPLRELHRAKISWAYVSSETLFRSDGQSDAEAEMARLTSAVLVAEKFNLRLAVIGPMGRHLPAAFSSISRLEEIYPTPDLWNHALRLGWERAVAEFRQLL
jgi:hypothetical protein